MPSLRTGTLPLRIIVEEPLPGVALALQHGKDGLERPAATSPTQIVFDFAVRVGAPKPDGTPNLLGPFAQGHAATRFVYICVGRRAGQATSSVDGRVKVPLTGITQAQVTALLAGSGQRLAVRLPGRNAKGEPTLATVRLPANSWKLVADTPAPPNAARPNAGS